MPSTNKYAQEYIQTICKQIRFKGIRNNIARELSDHIEDQKNEYIRQGFDEEIASLKAVEQMGDPILVGKQLDRTHRPKMEWSILSLAAILVLMGGIVQFFLSGVNASKSYVFSHFLKYAPIGIAAFVYLYFFDYTLLVRYSKLLYLILFLATLAGFLISYRRNGVYIHVYYSALLFIPIFAGIIYGFRNKGYYGIIVSGVFYAGAAFLCFLGPSFSSFFFLTVCCLIILTVAIGKGFFGCNEKVALAIVYVPTLITLFLAILIMPPSLQTRFYPELDPHGYGYLPLMVRRLFASSRPIGKAILEGDLAQMSIDRFLPSWNTDFMLTYIIARLGYIAGFIIVAVMFVLILRMFISVMKQKNAYGFLLSLSACLAITVQAVLFVLSNIGFISTFAVILPFISFGGIGFVINMILLGVLLSVYRRTDLVKDKLQGVPGSKPLFTFEDGKLIIDFGQYLDRCERRKSISRFYKNNV